MRISPIFEYRTGTPYTVLNAARAYERMATDYADFPSRQRLRVQKRIGAIARPMRIDKFDTVGRESDHLAGFEFRGFSCSFL